MKKLLVLLFSAMISFNSYGEWTEVSESVNGDIAYVDYDYIKKNNGYVYYWELFDMLKPIGSGIFSAKTFNEIVCNNPMKYRVISTHYYSLPMGEGPSDIDNTTYEWNYPSPGSTVENTLNIVCDYTN